MNDETERCPGCDHDLAHHDPEVGCLNGWVYGPAVTGSDLLEEGCDCQLASVGAKPIQIKWLSAADFDCGIFG